MTWLGMAAAALLLVFGAVGYKRGFIKEIISMIFLLLSVAVVWVINPAVSSIIKEQTPFYMQVRDYCKDALEKQLEPGMQLGREKQINMINQLPLPEDIKKGLIANNNAEVYKALAVDSFTDYVADYVASILTNGVGFIVSFILSHAAMRILVVTLGFMSRLPVLRGVNRLAGGAVGLAKGMIALWILGLAVTVLCNTPMGKSCMEMIQTDPFLTVVYDTDLFVKIFINIFYAL